MLFTNRSHGNKPTGGGNKLPEKVSWGDQDMKMNNEYNDIALIKLE